MTTASDIITRAARSIAYLGNTEVLSAADATDGLAVFNALLDSWSNERLMAYVTQQNSFTLTPGTQSYTIGTGGVINASRPLDLQQAWVRDTNNLDYPMTILPQDKWDNIGLKTITS